MSGNIHMALTAKGQALNAKIQKGDGTVPLEITRIVTASGYSEDPLNLEDVVDMRQTATITERKTFGVRASVTVILSNQGNPSAGEEPLREGYELRQIGCFAIDPDDGEILYRISQFERPNWIPAASEMGWTVNPTWNFVTGNAKDVIVQIDPKGLATRENVWNSVELSDRDVPDFGVRTHYRIVREVADYVLRSFGQGAERPVYVPVQGLLDVDGVSVQKAVLQLGDGSTVPLSLHINREG
ncbi:MAG: hypothetical protein FWD98_02585 [Defluviitaleaceae bacterium]|nr:hypothetical protein [Defluviitaleaceae bacterium]